MPREGLAAFGACSPALANSGGATLAVRPGVPEDVGVVDLGATGGASVAKTGGMDAFDSDEALGSVGRASTIAG